MKRKSHDPSFDPTPDQPLSLPTVAASVVDQLALVICWSRTEPARLGECAFVGRAPVALGRGGPRSDDSGPRAEFLAMRPGRNKPRPPLGAPNLSRYHLRLVTDQARLTFERHGKGPVVRDGLPEDFGHAAPGSTLFLANELLFLCERRPTSFPDSALSRTPDFTFGRADAFGLAGESPAAWRLREQIRFAAGSGAPLLVQGPAGAGKDLAARAVHAASAWRERSFVLLGGATLGRADLDALQARADAPFVVIDELADVPSEIQPFLARCIALTTSQPLPRTRIVAMSTTGLPSQEAPRPELASRFVLTIRVPGFEERTCDIPLVTRAILAEIAREQPEVGARFFEAWDSATLSGEPRLSPALVDRLLRHEWQAHARELTALLWTAMTTAKTSWVDLTPEVLAQLEATPSTHCDPATLDARAVQQALDDARGRVAVAARKLGLKNRWVLYRLMEKLDIVT